MTSLKPGVIVDETVIIFKASIKARNMQKFNKYTHFMTNIESHLGTVTAFEDTSQKKMK